MHSSATRANVLVFPGGFWYNIANTRMSNAQSDSQSPSSLRPEFTTTHWSVVLLAGGATSSAADAALEHLCRSYWYPLYAYVRRQGHSESDAQDLTQSFFARLLERKYLRLADRNQ